MGLFDFLKGKSELERFADKAMARLKEMGWEHPMHYEAERDILQLGGDAGMMPLAETFRHWRTYPKAEQDSVLTQAVASAFDRGPPPTFEVAAPQLTPVIWPRARVEAMLNEPADPPEDARGDLTGVWRPLADHLAVLVAIDKPHSLVTVDNAILRSWSRSFDEVFETAMKNLRAGPGLTFDRYDGNFRAATCPDDNALAKLLLAAPFAELNLKRAPVVVAAWRPILTVAEEGDEVALEAMAQFVGGLLQDESRPASYAPIVWRNGEWRMFDPPPELTEVRTLLQLQKAMEYELQAPLILGRLAREGRRDELAEFRLLPFSKPPETLAIWISPVSLLPKADLIAIRSKEHGTLVRFWADVEAACGGFVQEPQTATPYSLAAGWPGAAAMAQILNAPEPEWARGRGVSFTNGHISLAG